MKSKITLLLLICSIGVHGQLKLEELSGIANLELLQRLELSIINLVPTVDEYETFNESIRSLPPEYVKYVDSIDYSRFNKKLSVIQIYSKNRVYRSENSYDIKKNDNNDSLFLANINLNMNIRDDIIGYEEYENQEVEYEITEKKIKKDIIINRIIFSKDQNFKSKNSKDKTNV